MADVTQLQATLSLDSSNVVEGGTVSFTVSIRNTIGSNRSFGINSVTIGDKDAFIIEKSDAVSIPYRSTTAITGKVYVPEVVGDAIPISVRIGYGSGEYEYESEVSSTINVKSNLVLSNRIVDDLMVENKRIIQLDAGDKTIWRNGVWFSSNPEFIGYNRLNEYESHESSNVTANFYNHNHLIRNTDVDIYNSTCLVKQGLCNPFDFFTSYGALTVTRTLDGFTASGEQQALYTCNTVIESGDIINFDIQSISTSEAVYLEVFNDDNSYYDKINLSNLHAENIQLKFNNIRKFTLYVDGDEYDVYESDEAYYKFRFNIGGGNITVDNFHVEKKLSESFLLTEKIDPINIEAYRSYLGTHFYKTGNNTHQILVGDVLPNPISRLDVDIVRVSGVFKLQMNPWDIVLSDFVSDNSHLTITHDGYYTEIFVDNILMKSIKSEATFVFYLLRISDECILKNIEVQYFDSYDTVTIDGNGDATVEYVSDDKGDVYFLGRFENLPTISYHLEDCTYKPEYNANTAVIKQGSNGNAYQYDSESNIGYFKGAVLSEGWDNTGLWECTFDLAYNHGGTRYTGLILITNPDNPFDGGDIRWGISGWEGPITGTPRNGGSVTNYVKNGHLTSLLPGQIVSNGSNPSVDWHTVHVRKESSTCLVVWKNDDYENRVTYMWEDLELASKVTIGGRTNMANSLTISQYGSTCIRNLRVKTY